MSNKLVKFPKQNNKTETKTMTMSANTLYEANKQLISQVCKPLTHLELAPIESKLEDWFNMIIDTYAMLLCHDKRDYTIFHLYEKENKNPPAVAAKELIGCLLNRGEILSIEENKDKAWEIWLRIDNEIYCYYLFRYDDAVIEC